MTDPGFPSQHVTTTSVQTTNTSVETTLRFDPSYLKSVPGILKVVQIIANMLGFICIEASGGFSSSGQGSWFNFVSGTGFWFTAILLALYLFHVVEKFYKIPWLKVEFLFCAIWTVFHLVGSCIAVTFGVDAYVAAGFFGFCAMIAYGIDAFFKFKAIKSGQLAQGVRVMNKQTTVISSPAY